MASYTEIAAGKIDFPLPAQRTNKFPLDRSSMFGSYADAVKYAAGNTSDFDSRELAGTSYVGQIIVVYEDSVVTAYLIQEDRTLKEVGSATMGDGKSIDLIDGTLHMHGFDNATANQQVRKNASGELEWFTPDTSVDIHALSDQVQTNTSDISNIKTDITDIQTKISTAFVFKGYVDYYNELIAKENPSAGDVWGVRYSGTTGTNPLNAEYIYTGDGTWEEFGSFIDLSGYVTTEAMNAAIADLTTVEASETNGNIKIDGTETTVYTLPSASTDVKGGVKVDGTTITSVDGTISVNIIDASKVNGSVSSAAKVDHTLTFGTTNVKFDGSSDVTVTAADVGALTAADLTDYVKKTDYASTDVGGTVVSSDGDNQIAVGSDGKMTVNNIDASKVQGSVANADVAATANKTANSVTFTNPNGDNVIFDGSEAKTVGIQSLVKVDDTTTDHVHSTATGDLVVNKVSSATGADKLNTPIDISISGDVVGSVTDTDLSGDVSISVTMPEQTGLSTGSYTKVTVNTKGQVTAGANLEAADIPNLTSDKITDLGALATKDEVAKTDLATALSDEITANTTATADHETRLTAAEGDISTLKTNVTSLQGSSHTHTNKTVLDGITEEKVAAWDAAETNVQADWSESDDTSDAFIKNKPDVYTKTEVDSKLSAVYRYKGSSTIANLPTEGQTVGDVYNITDAGTIGELPVNAGDNVAWTAEGWDVLAGAIDLSGYSEVGHKHTVSDITDLVVHSHTNKAILDGIDSKNLIKTIYSVNNLYYTDDVGVYIPTDGSNNIGIIGNEYVSDTEQYVSLQILTGDSSHVKQWTYDGSTWTLSFEDTYYFLTNEQRQLINTIKTGGYIKSVTASTTNGNILVNGDTEVKAYELPAATDTVLGGVKVDNTTISVADGVISVTDKVLTSDDVLVLDGGGAAGY